MNADASFYNGEVQGDATHNTSAAALVALPLTTVFSTTTTVSSAAPGGYASVDPTKTSSASANGLSGNVHHIAYTSPGRHGAGGASGGGVGNFTYGDGHAKSLLVSETLDPTDYQWGTHVWSQVNQAQIYADTALTTPVN
jgi:prepilin-type processing-associated H-X9-DG protein